MNLIEKQRRIDLAIHQAEVLQAFANGIPTQVRREGRNGEWRPLDHTNVNLYLYEIRIKPAPDEVWLNMYNNMEPVVHNSAKDAEEGHNNTSSYVETRHYIQVMDE